MGVHVLSQSQQVAQEVGRGLLRPHFHPRRYDDHVIRILFDRHSQKSSRSCERNRGRVGADVCASRAMAETSNRILGQFLRTRLAREALQRPRAAWIRVKLRPLVAAIHASTCAASSANQAQAVVKYEFSLLRSSELMGCPAFWRALPVLVRSALGHRKPILKTCVSVIIPRRARCCLPNNRFRRSGFSPPGCIKNILEEKEITCLCGGG